MGSGVCPNPKQLEGTIIREQRETKIERLKADLIRAKEKASEWQARVRDIERQITEQENLEIIQAVRSRAAAPEDLRGLLDMIRAAKIPAQNNSVDKEEI